MLRRIPVLALIVLCTLFAVALSLTGAGYPQAARASTVPPPHTPPLPPGATLVTQHQTVWQRPAYQQQTTTGTAAGGPLTASVCYDDFGAGKVGSNFFFYDEVYCNGTIYAISQQEYVVHCTLYIGGCIIWSGRYSQEPRCTQMDNPSGWVQFCPESGLYWWDNVPSGWLIAAATDCYITWVPGQTTFQAGMSNGYQF